MSYNSQVEARSTPLGHPLVGRMVGRMVGRWQANRGRFIRGTVGKLVYAIPCWGMLMLSIAPLQAEPPSAVQHRQLVDPWQMPAGTAIWGLPPQSPHRLIQSPPLLSAEEKKARSHRGKLTPAVATIDRAAVQNVWRQPYAYGYFGAQPNRHWQRHFGWNQAYTQWTLK
ncbi:hypothetical protein SH139x_001183 [Planctomycetaceae bacterium SH139]